MAFFALCHGLWLSVSIHHKVSNWYISRTDWPRIAKFDANILTDLPYSHTRWTSPATSGQHLLKFEKRPKMPSPTALGQILVVWRFAGQTNWWAACYVTEWSAMGSICSGIERWRTGLCKYRRWLWISDYSGLFSSHHNSVITHCFSSCRKAATTT